MTYTVVSVIAAFSLPRLENAYFPFLTAHISVASAQAFFAAVSSGMMALSGMVFAIVFVVVQFSSFAYSPRLVIMFASNPALYHSLGLFFATFSYSLVTLLWTDRGQSGAVPLLSTGLVALLLVASMLVFVRLIQSLGDLQIHNILQIVGAQGRSVIRAMFPFVSDDPETAPRNDIAGENPELGPVTQTLMFSGTPRVVARFDVERLVRFARRARAVVAIECAVGDTLVEEAILLHVYGARRKLSERKLRGAIHLATSRTFEQDPKYPIRLLVDIAIRALSPAVNDPTTAVQALDHIEDLLHRLGRRQLDAGRAYDRNGELRLIFPVPTWEDYLCLSFDEIRQYGANSVQVVRRLRSVLVGLQDVVASAERREVVRRYLDHLNAAVNCSDFDEFDRRKALEEDRQGLGLSRKRAQSKLPAGESPWPTEREMQLAAK